VAAVPVEADMSLELVMYIVVVLQVEAGRRTAPVLVHVVEWSVAEEVPKGHKARAAAGAFE